MTNPEVGDIVHYRSGRAGEGYGIIVSLRRCYDAYAPTESHWCGVRFILPPYDWPRMYAIKEHCDIECTNVWLTKVGHCED